MKKISPPFILLAVALVFAGVWVTMDRNRGPQGPQPGEENKFRPAAAGRNATTGSRPAVAPGKTAGLAPAFGFVRKDVAEVFPDGGPRGSDWRERHPETLRVAPYPGITLTFHQTQRKEEGRHLTWVGRNAAMPGATFVGVATANGYDAVLLLPEAGQYNFHVRDGRVLVEEVVSSGQDCEPDPMRAPAAPILTMPSGVRTAEAGNATHANPAASGSIEAAEGAPSVDVLFLYNTRALAVAAQRSTDPVGYIDGYARAGLETCNQVLVNSRVESFRWRYIGLVLAPEYPEKQTVSEDLAMIGPNGQFASFVSQVRAQYGADQVLMWVGAGTRQGAAYTGETRGTPVPVEYAVAGLRLTAGILILAHELAHNFGCQHDRGHAGTGDGSTATPEGDGRWCYGLLWFDTVDTSSSGTVMAYADFLVPYFSNPDIVLNVTAGTQTIGFPESDSRAANNARVMREYGPYMAALNAETEAMPVILQQPRDAALQTGEALSLSVSAMGGGLGYQWLKDGVAVAGATEPVLSRTFAATDAGNYSVRVTNRRGTVTSRTAAVSLGVTTAPPIIPAPAPPAASSSGGGGGGGGAPSLWFNLAWLVLVLVRAKKSLARR